MGHPSATKCFSRVAKSLVECVRGSDTVSRQGGDEFVVLLSEVAQSEDAAITATECCRAMGAVIITISMSCIYASIGVSVYPMTD